MEERKKAGEKRLAPEPASRHLVLEAQGKFFNPFDWVKEHKYFLESN